MFRKIEKIVAIVTCRTLQRQQVVADSGKRLRRRTDNPEVVEALLAIVSHRPDFSAAVERCERPVVVIAHSLGVVALVRAAPRIAATVNLAGAFLVAPPGETALIGIPEIDAAFRPYPTDPLPFRSLLVGSHDDPYAGIEETATLSAVWGSVFVDAGNAGHINAESGHGPWPEGLMTFAGFLSRL